MSVRGRVGGLWRHPVKSAGGQQVPALVIAAAGVVGDRAWAVRDLTTGAVLSAKREPRLLLVAAQAVGEGVSVSVPGMAGASMGQTAGSDADALLSEWLGRPVRLELAGVDAGRRGGFVDEAHLHLVGAGELGQWDVRRFRPNVVVHDMTDLDGLVGERLQLGTAVVEVDKRTKRCAMPTMAQGCGLGKDVGVLRALARDRELRLGVYAHVVTPGRVEVGAPITIA